MQVKNVMTTAPISVTSGATLWEAIQLMRSHNVSGLPVLDQSGALVGVVSEGDLLRRAELGTTRADGGWVHNLFHPGGLAEAYKLAHARTVANVMSTNPIAVEPSLPLEQAVSMMETHRIKRLPVVDGGLLVGILSRADFLRVLGPMLSPTYEEPATSDAEIERTIGEELGRQDWAAGTAVTAASRNGDVTLSGTILSEAQRDAVRVLAENVNGVHSVTDHLVWADPMLRYAI